jgi:hypothetical protein
MNTEASPTKTEEIPTSEEILNLYLATEFFTELLTGKAEKSTETNHQPSTEATIDENISTLPPVQFTTQAEFYVNRLLIVDQMLGMIGERPLPNSVIFADCRAIGETLNWLSLNEFKRVCVGRDLVETESIPEVIEKLNMLFRSIGTLSSKNFEIELQNGIPFVHNFKPSNKTVLNNQELESNSKAQLHDNDILRAGHLIVVVSL